MDTRPETRTALRTVKLLVGGYLLLSVVTFAAIVLLRGHRSVVNDAVWIRGTIVALTSLLMFSFAARAARGSRGAFLRLRIASAVMVVAIIVIISLPGTFPLWLRLEQSVCGLLLLCVVVLVNGRHLRSLFAGA
ncbi:hypothetical protein OG417_08390 [Actinoallomurus sp. NBC_01490]|uniref:hypothetical protein n=1 Tax=Actinoallomurus sp. NBC_01490 TaxID=2903557 RepID=UPI002E30843F|nr:hypothetical protein [Actinoallomurus sp. NBC_01490]